MENKKIDWQELKHKYCEKENEYHKEEWDGKKLCSSSEIKLLTTPELLNKYIDKYELYSSEAEIKLLSTPELVSKYIDKYGISVNLKKIIKSKL